MTNPEPLNALLLAIAVLTLAVATNGYAVSLSGRKLAADNNGLRSIFRNIGQPLVKGVFCRDLIGTFTSIIGIFALLIYESFDLLIFDALGAIFTAVLMMMGSFVLLIQARELITGRALPE